MPVPPTWIKFHKSCENWRVDGVLDNTVLITIGLEKLKTKWSIISRLSMIVRVNVVQIGLLLLTVTDVKVSSVYHVS